MNRTIVERARSMLHYKKLETKWWAEAVNTAVYLINRSTNSAHISMTPFEICFKQKPSMQHLRVFGSRGYAHIDSSKRSKFDAKSFRCIFLGYADNTKGYKVWDIDGDKMRVSRSLMLDERA
ncbi:hypothetical protein PybrP1_003733, partial [[Pythium] brassicae (nom. inval.)]